MIHILDGQSNVILSTITKKNILHNEHRRSLEDYLESFEFTALADKEFSEFLTNRNRIIVPAEDEGYTEFILDEVVKRRSDGLEVRVLAMASYLELKKASVIEPQTLNEYTPSMAIGFATNETEWRPGRIESNAFRTFNISTHTNPFAFLKTVANEFDLELNFRTETRGGRVVGRYVDLLERVGDWKGREITFGKDLEGIERKEDVSNIYTALLCLSPEDEDGNRLETLVGDREALQRWGRPNPITGELKHLIDVYEPQSDRSDMTLEELRQYGRTELNKRINAVVTYECDIVDLENVPGMENKKIRFGDTIRIKDEKFNPPLYVEARVFEQERDIFTKANKHVKLGDFIEFTEEEVRDIWRQLQAQINARVSFNELQEYTYNKEEIEQRDLTIYNNSKDYADTAVENVEIDDNNFRDDQPPTPQNVEAEGFFKVIAVKWDYNSSSTIASYEVYASQTPGFTPAVSNLVWSGKAGNVMFEAETNEMWFFRVRAVNTRGTASGYSSEVSAETVRVQDIDVEIGAINAEKLADLAVTAEKLADGAVTEDKIEEQSIVETKIKDDSISTPKLQSQAITSDKVAANSITAENGAIADLAIGNAAIQNGAITNAKIENAAITDAKIADATITSAKIHSVTADKLDVAELSAVTGNLGSMTAGDITGVSITAVDGDFFLKESKTDTKYSIVAKQNLIRDHSFERIPVTGSLGGDNTWSVSSQSHLQSYSRWRKEGEPRLTRAWSTDGSLSVFGLQGGVVNSSNYFTQTILGHIKPGATYTLSAHFYITDRSSSATPRLRIRLTDEPGGSLPTQTWDETFPTVTTSDGAVRRHSITFTIPSNTEFFTGGNGLVVEARAGGSGWIGIDGMQLVEGETPTLYDPEDTAFISQGEPGQPIVIRDGLIVTGTSGASNAIQLGSGNYISALDNKLSLQMWGNRGSNGIQIRMSGSSTGTPMQWSPDGLTIMSRNLLPSFSGTANLRLATGDSANESRLGLLSSRRELKQEIEKLEITDDQLMSLKAIKFRDKSECKERGDDAPHYLGLVAEDVAESDVPELADFDGNGNPFSVNYDRVGVALLPVVQRLVKQVDELKQKLEESE